MAPKRSAAAAAAAAAASAPTPDAAPTSTITAKTDSDSTKSFIDGYIEPFRSFWNSYQKNTPHRTKLLDLFMAFLLIVGALQFAYCLIGGNFPFNAFLAGFSATVGQFVLTASLRIQTTEENKADFPSVSPERAFADYIVGSLILHFFCLNFIN
ncbi:oligosaccharyltransferase complex subunit epsilon [Parahypoxylon ruwenzoriense]